MKRLDDAPVTLADLSETTRLTGAFCCALMMVLIEKGLTTEEEVLALAARSQAAFDQLHAAATRKLADDMKAKYPAFGSVIERFIYGDQE